ncbi:MAG: anaerobic ribonucleoside-triphosphate reductase activating protein [Thermoplasmatales archaeon]|nr:anaerobic ribonucleoside-triphosphate reductase activating protein [Thermoplasmatales archaeon]
MKIKGMIEASFLDWDGKIVTTVFVPGCNFRCPYCQNWELIEHPEKFEEVDFERMKKFLLSHKDFIDGLCITGGEPTIYEDLPDFIKKIKKLDFTVKLDTNGSKPGMIKKLIDEKLVDYIAMDMKAPFEKYDTACGVKVDMESIKRSIDIIMNSKIGYEFRTTVVPGITDESDVENIAKTMKRAKRYVLQQFIPKNAMDEKLRNITPYRKDIFEKMVEKAKKYVKNTVMRGV